MDHRKRGSLTPEVSGGRWNDLLAVNSLPIRAAPPPAARSRGFRIYPDGDQWCAVPPDFVSLQESVAGFGCTPSEALEALEMNLRVELEAEWDDNGLETICSRESFVEQAIAALLRPAGPRK